MSDREPAAWESSAAGPFVTLADGRVEVWARGNDRFLVRSPAGESEVDGHDEAMQLAHELASEP